MHFVKINSISANHWEVIKKYNEKEIPVAVARKKTYLGVISMRNVYDLFKENTKFCLKS